MWKVLRVLLSYTPELLVYFVSQVACVSRVGDATILDTPYRCLLFAVYDKRHQMKDLSWLRRDAPFIDHTIFGVCDVS